MTKDKKTDKAKKIREGDVRTASRLIRGLEDHLPGAKSELRHIYPFTGKAHIIGLTGAPGAGKSTLADALIGAFRGEGKTVGVLAVDPTSPFTGGAILGDRIRMQRHAEDPGVFVRSLATRGALGGLSKAVGDAVHVMDAMGKDVIIVETVGTGQQEVEIIHHAHTVIVILVPGMGDDIQVIKAGIMEIADVFVINKADRKGALPLENEIALLLNMAHNFPGGWRPPVVKIGNVFEPEVFRQGVKELCAKVQEHYRHLIDTDRIGDRLRRKALLELNESLTASILEPVLRELIETGEMAKMADAVLKKESDPYSLAEQVASRYLKRCFGNEDSAS